LLDKLKEKSKSKHFLRPKLIELMMIHRKNPRTTPRKAPEREVQTNILEAAHMLRVVGKDTKATKKCLAPKTKTMKKVKILMKSQSCLVRTR